MAFRLYALTYFQGHSIAIVLQYKTARFLIELSILTIFAAVSLLAHFLWFLLNS